jgi:hypothetical protein
MAQSIVIEGILEVRGHPVGPDRDPVFEDIDVFVEGACGQLFRGIPEFSPVGGLVRIFFFRIPLESSDGHVISVTSFF